MANFIYSFSKKPKVAAVYNIGGGFQNSVSVLEAIEKIENISEKKMKSSYLDKARVGDHICYYSDLSKIKLDYPDWGITKSIDDIFVDIHNGLINKKRIK